MKSLFSQSNNSDIEFELFSNVVLKFTAILMVVMVLLAINVGQKLDTLISPSRFSGGSARPQLYIGAWRLPDFKSDNSDYNSLYFSLFSPSLANASTTIKDGKLNSIINGETFSGMNEGSALDILNLLAGIDPGFLLVDGIKSPFIVPNFTEKMLFGDGYNNVPPSRDIAISILRLWSDVYNNPVYPVRNFSEFKNSRTRIYIESSQIGASHQIVIGNTLIDSSKIQSGEFDFLSGLSSTNTEVIYLGEYEMDDKNKTTTRIAFFETHGFLDAARNTRSLVFPSDSEHELVASYYNKYPSWEQMPKDFKDDFIKKYLKDNKINSTLADINKVKDTYYEAIFRLSIKKYRDDLLEKAIESNRIPDKNLLPVIIAYPDAWKAYVEYRLKSKPVPPEWIIKEFLEPLGFDKRVVITDE